MDQLPRLKIYPPGHYVELDGEALYLGRDCHLAALIPALLNKVVSNRHCVVRREGTRWMLEDLGSTNGTWIHGQRLAGKTLLHTGDEFRLGKQGPLVRCDTGFGGTGPDRTTPEDEMPGAAQVDTLVEEPRPQQRKGPDAPPHGGPPPRSAANAPAAVAPAARISTPDGRDGSAVLPFRVGRTPSLRLVHQRNGEQFAVSGYTIVIGRDPGAAQVVIRADDERHVSGRHVEIQFRTDHTVVVRDLGSRNGSWLNDKPLKGEAPLRVGDRLLLGNAPTVLTVAALDG
jgi:pSer/pThr/pTyr-binding forkhead associated (FHA) protein